MNRLAKILLVLVYMFLPYIIATFIVSSKARGDILTQTYALSNARESLDEIVRVEAVVGDVDPEFLYYLHTIIHLESGYDTDAVSEAGAIGIMQVMGPAVLDAAAYCGIPTPPLHTLLELETNVLYGTCYLALLLDRFDGEWYSTLVAYHGGYVAANKLSNHGRINANTANYVLQIMYHLRDQPVTTRYTGRLPGSIRTGDR